jgi:ribosomal protein S12 methylthiotransferase accessory factor
LLELIERDAFVIHWYARIAPPKLDLDTICDPELHFLIQRLRRTDFEIFLLDTRLDIPVPSVTAVAVRRDRGLGTLSLAAGCSFDPESAIASALGEVASHYVGLEDRVKHAENRLRSAVTNMALVQTMEDHSLLYGFPEALEMTDFLLSNKTVRSVKDSYSEWTEQLPRGSDLRDDIAYCLGLLKQAGLGQVVVVDQTSPEGLGFGIHTVRVIVPGLMPLDFGFERCRGASLPRMYSVPVDLGHRTAPGTAADLNYVPHPFP